MRVRRIALVAESGSRRLRADFAGVSHPATRSCVGGAPVSIERLQGAPDRGAPPRGRHLATANLSSGPDDVRPDVPGGRESTRAACDVAVVHRDAGDAPRLASPTHRPALDVRGSSRTTVSPA